MQVPALALGVVQLPGDLGAKLSRQVVKHHVDLERHTAASSAQPRQNVFEPTGASANARQARSEAASDGAAVATHTQEGWHLTQRCWRSADHTASSRRPQEPQRRCAIRHHRAVPCPKWSADRERERGWVRCPSDRNSGAGMAIGGAVTSGSRTGGPVESGEGHLHDLAVTERVILAPVPGDRLLSPDDVLKGVADEQVIGFVEGPGDSTPVRTPFGTSLMGLLASAGERVREGQPVAWVRLVHAAGPEAETAPSSDLQMNQLVRTISLNQDMPSALEVLQARRNAEARLLLLQEFGGLTSSEVADLVGSEGRNRASLAHRWRKKGRLLGIPYKGAVLYPAFQFHRRTVVSVVPEILGASPVLVSMDGRLPYGSLLQIVCSVSEDQLISCWRSLTRCRRSAS